MSDQGLPEPGAVDPPKDTPPEAPSAAKDVPPKRDRSKATTTTRASSLEKRLTEMYVSIGTMVVVADLTCGTAIITSAPDTAAALDALAKENPKVKRALEKMLAGGAWGGVLMAHAPIITTVLAHHNMLPAQVAESMGVTPKVKPTLHAVEQENGQRVGSREPAS